MLLLQLNRFHLYIFLSLAFVHVLCALDSSSLGVAIEEDSAAKVHDVLTTQMDLVLNDLVKKYQNIEADDFWHPYSFGVENQPEATNPILQESLGLFDMFKGLSKRMNAWRNDVSNAENILSKKINVNGDNEIIGEWSVKTISTDEVAVVGREARSDEVFSILKFGSVEWTEEDFLLTNEQLMDRLTTMEDGMIMVRTELNHALVKNSASPQIVSTGIIMNGMIAAVNGQVQNYVGNTLWGKDANEFFQSLSHKGSQEMNIEGDISFMEAITTKKLQTRSINEVLVNDMARLKADNKVTCATTFNSIESLDDIQVVSTVNSLNLQESVVMAENIEGFKLSDGIVSWGGATVNEHLPFSDVLLSSSSQTVNSPMVFPDVKVNSPVSIGTMNDVDFEDFANKVIFKNFQGKIKGTKIFSAEPSINTLFMSSWNDLSFPDAFLSSTQSDIVLNGAKSFERLTTDQLIVAGDVDGVNTDELVSHSGFDELDSTWTFNGPTRIETNIAVDNTVDGISMKSLEHKGLLDSDSEIFSPNADILFEQPVFVEKLQVEDSLNGRDFDEIFKNVIMFEGTKCSVPGRTTMMGDVVFKNIMVKDNQVNGFSTQNFLTKDTAQDISGPVILSGSTFFQELLAMGSFDNVQIADVLTKAMRISEATTLTVPWDVHFESVSFQDKFIAKGAINGLGNYKNVVARTRGSSSQVFLGNVVMNGATLKSLSTGHLTLDEGHTLQTLDVNQWNTNRARLSQPALFSRQFSVNNILVQSKFDTLAVNEVTVAQLQDEVFRSDRDSQEFAGPVKVLNGITVLNGDITFQKKVDGFFLSDFVNHGLPLDAKNDRPIVLDKSWFFQAIRMTNGIEMSGTDVCNVNLNDLLVDSVKHSDLTLEVSGHKAFTQPLEIRRNMATTLINGKLSESIFKLNQDNQKIEDEATFNADVFKRNLDVESVNDVKVSWLSTMYNFEKNQHVINHDVLFKGDLITDSMSVSGTTQMKNLAEFLEASSKHSDPGIVFTKEVILEEAMSSRENIQVGNYNGVDIDALADEVVKVNENNVFGQTVSFPGVVKSKDLLRVNGDLEAKNLGNGMDWNELRDNAIRINQDIEGSLDRVQFDHAVLTKPTKVSRLNDIMFEDFVTLDSPQNLGTLRIKTAFADSSNVDIQGRMGQFKIADEFKDTLMSNEESLQRMTGVTKINGPIQVKNHLDCFGANLKDEVMSTRENFVLQGPVEFDEPLVIEQDMQFAEPTQGQNIKSIFTGAFFTSTDVGQIVSKRWEFRAPVTFLEDVSGQALGDKANIQALILEKENEIKEAKERVAAERNRFKRQCVALSAIRSEIARHPVKLDSFEVQQIISVPGEAANILTMESNDKKNPLMILETTNCQLHLYRWNPETEIFHQVVHAPKMLGGIRSWQSSLTTNGNVIVLAKQVSRCSSQGGLFSMKVSESGEISPVKIISQEKVKSFKLTRSKETGKVIMFAVFRDRENELNVLEWTEEENAFAQKSVTRAASALESVDTIITTSDDIQVIGYTRGSMQTFQYSETGDQGVLIDKDSWPTITTGTTLGSGSTKAPMTVFQDVDDTVYGLVPEAGTCSGIIQRSCSLQVIRFSESQAIESIQTLQVPDVVSYVQWTFSDENFVAFLSKFHGLSVYKFMGVNGFQPIATPSRVFDGSILKMFSIRKSGLAMPQPFLLSMSSNSIQILKGNVFGDRFTDDFQDLCDEA